MKIKYLLLMILFLTTGCWNYTELNDLAIVKGVSIDQEEDNYIVNYMISNASSEKGSSKDSSPQTALIEGKGKTISEAISEIKLISPKKIYIGHMLVYVISEAVAKNSLTEATDYFFRNNNSKRSFQVVIAKDTKAKDTLKILSPLDSFPSDNIAKNLATAESFSGYVSNSAFVSFIRKIKEDGIDASANGITIIGSTEKGSSEENLKSSSIDNYVKIEPLAIFKKDQLVAWTDQDVSKGINIFLSAVQELKLTIPYKDGYFSFKITNIKSSSDFKINDNITFDFKIKATSNIEEMTIYIDTKKEDNIKLLEELINNEIKRILHKTTQFIQEKQSDAIGLGYRIYINDYQNWLNLKTNWNETHLPKVKVNFEVKTTLLAEEDTNEGTAKSNK
ncbi:MAG: Ger(x)C family spore germination protein [Bacilli bacterium]|nr:Ger(x)C family spore germination protein [Bacilli bacterium]